jgi:PAS domain-containing protein
LRTDVTEFIQLRQHGAEQVRQTEALRARTEQMEVDIFARAQQLQEANRRLRAGEERFCALMDSAPDAMIVVDELGTIALVNARTESLFGYPREELLGEPIEKLIAERYRSIHPPYRTAYIQARCVP